MNGRNLGVIEETPKFEFNFEIDEASESEGMDDYEFGAPDLGRGEGD